MTGESEQVGNAAVGHVTPVPADDPARLALVAEAVRRLSALRHDAIVSAVALAQAGAHWSIVERVPEGERLDRIVREHGALPAIEALHVARQLADGLAAAHAGGVVHGAIAPTDVWIRRGDRPRAALAGFAPAAVTGPPPAYTPPERFRGEPADARSDVFALGLVLFEMLEGRPMLAGTSDEIRETLLGAGGPLLPRFRHIPPTGVSALIARTVRRAPAHRPQTMVQLRGEIEACLARLGEIRIEATRARAADAPVRRRTVVVDDALLDEPAPAAMPARTPPVSRRGRRGPLAAAVVVVLAVAAAGALAVRTSRVELEAAAPPPAHTEPAPVADAPEPAAPAEEPVVVAAPPDAAAPDVAAALPAEPVPEVVIAVSEPTPVPNAAPRVVGRRPEADRLEVGEGTVVDFHVRATDDAAAPLRYTWLVDGRVVARTPRWRFAAPSAASGTVAVQARVADAAGLAAALVSWRVAIAPRMSEPDVRGWLERLATAWERRDLETLRLHGVLGADTDRVRLGRRMTIVNERIHTDGRYATVAFDAAVRDGEGRIVWSGRESYELEKQPGGVIARR